MRWFLLVFVLVAVLIAGLFGMRGEQFKSRPTHVFPDMDDQYKLKFQRQTDFFADGRVQRVPVAGTVPMGYAIPSKPVSEGGIASGDFSYGAKDYYSTGMIGDYFGQGMPEGIEVNDELLARGQERFGIYCTMCHGDSGNGAGVVAKYYPGGMLPPTANILNDTLAGRLGPLADGQVFHTITAGKGLMGPYGGNIPIADRWAIVAYVRALRISGNADLSKPEVKAAFDAAVKAQEAKPEPAPAAADNSDA